MINNPDGDNDNIDVEEIMNRIRSNVEKRHGIKLRKKTDSSCVESCSDMYNISKNDIDLDGEMEHIQSNSDITKTNYHISSHRPIIGYFLVKGRKLVNGEVKRSVIPSLSNQSSLNMSVSKVLSGLVRIYVFIESKLEELNDKYDSLHCDVSEQISELNKLKSEFRELSLTLELETKNTNSNLDELKIEFNKLSSKKELTSWAELYSREITEQDLVDNVTYHKYFITTIEKFAEKSAGEKPPKILEVGLGNATMSIYLSRDCFYDVYGIDNDVRVLNHNMEINENLGGYAKFMLVDAFNLDLFKHKYFDVAFSQGTLEHFDNRSIIELIKKQLEIATYVIFSVPSYLWPTREIGNERKLNLDEWKILLGDSNLHVELLEYYKDNLHVIGVISQLEVA